MVIASSSPIQSYTDHALSVFCVLCVQNRMSMLENMLFGNIFFRFSEYATSLRFHRWLMAKYPEYVYIIIVIRTV